MQSYEQFLQEKYTKRELQLILNCLTYASNDPAGLPAHNLMLVIAKMWKDDWKVVQRAVDTYPDN